MVPVLCRPLRVAQKPDRTDHLAPETVRAAAEGRRVTDWLDSPGLRTVHLGLVDASGTLREKRLGRSAAARAFEDGWSFIDAIQWWGPDDTLWQRAGATSGQAAVETDSGRPVPLCRRRHLLPGGIRRATAGALAPLPAPTHGRAGRVVGDLRHGSLGSSSASCSTRPSAPRARHSPVMAANRCWSALTMATEDEELGNLVGTLEAGAIPVDHVCAELGPGCLEIATGPEPALRAADSAALAKVYTKAHFARAGRRATFMAQLGPGFPGLGGHPSLSLHRLADDTPLLCDEPGILSKVGCWAVAGVVTLLPELLAMAAPNPNSFRRFGPGNWAPATATWGPDAYSCALRVVAHDPRSGPARAAHPGGRHEPPPLPGDVPRRRHLGYRGATRTATAGRPAGGRPRRWRSCPPPRPHRSRRAIRRQHRGPGALRPRLRRALRAVPSRRGGGLPPLRLRTRSETVTSTRSEQETEQVLEPVTR